MLILRDLLIMAVRSMIMSTGRRTHSNSATEKDTRQVSLPRLPWITGYIVVLYHCAKPGTILDAAERITAAAMHMTDIHNKRFALWLFLSILSRFYSNRREFDSFCMLSY